MSLCTEQVKVMRYLVYRTGESDATPCLLWLVSCHSTSAMKCVTHLIYREVDACVWDYADDVW